MTGAEGCEGPASLKNMRWAGAGRPSRIDSPDGVTASLEEVMATIAWGRQALRLRQLRKQLSWGETGDALHFGPAPAAPLHTGPSQLFHNKIDCTSSDGVLSSRRSANVDSSEVPASHSSDNSRSPNFSSTRPGTPSTYCVQTNACETNSEEEPRQWIPTADGSYQLGERRPHMSFTSSADFPYGARDPVCAREKGQVAFATTPFTPNDHSGIREADSVREAVPTHAQPCELQQGVESNVPVELSQCVWSIMNGTDKLWARLRALLNYWKELIRSDRSRNVLPDSFLGDTTVIEEKLDGALSKAGSTREAVEQASIVLREICQHLCHAQGSNKAAVPSVEGQHGYPPKQGSTLRAAAFETEQRFGEERNVSHGSPETGAGQPQNDITTPLEIQNALATRRPPTDDAWKDRQFEAKPGGRLSATSHVMASPLAPSEVNMYDAALTEEAAVLTETLRRVEQQCDAEWCALMDTKRALCMIPELGRQLPHHLPVTDSTAAPTGISLDAPSTISTPIRDGDAGFTAIVSQCQTTHSNQPFDYSMSESAHEGPCDRSDMAAEAKLVSQHLHDEFHRSRTRLHLLCTEVAGLQTEIADIEKHLVESPADVKKETHWVPVISLNDVVEISRRAALKASAKGRCAAPVGMHA